MKKRLMVFIFTGILSGMAVVWNALSMTTAFYLLIAILAIIILIVKDRRYGWIIVGVVFGVIFSVLSKTSMEIDLYEAQAHGEQYAIGTVLEVSETRTGKQALLLKNDTLEGKILLYTPEERTIKEGDVVSFDGTIDVWEDATNPGQFSSRNYYFSKGIYYHAYSKNIQIQSRQSSRFSAVIKECREYFKRKLKIQYKKDVRNFLNGMLLGDKKELSDEVKDDFKTSGLIHLLAVSGLHISLAGMGVYRFFRRFCGNFLISSIVGISGAIFYCCLTGMSLSSLRAVIMLGIYFVAQVFGEHYDLLSSASFAGVLLLLLWPYRIYDTGFIYSFAAVFVIGIYQQIKPSFKGNFQKIKESLCFCVAIEIGMFPLMIYFQYETPIFSFLANVAAVPLATTAFTMAFLTIFLPYTFLHSIISYIIEVVLWISRQSYGMLTIGHVPFYWVILFYIVLCFMLNKRFGKLPIRICFIYMGILLLTLIPMKRKKTIAFLDVGQGDCFVADSDAGLIVFDGGSSSVDQVGRYRILPYIKYCGYQKIKVAMISHMDLDHYSGILELLKMGKIEYLGLADIKKDAAMEKIIKIAKKQDTKLFYLSKGRKIRWGKNNLFILHPKKESLLEKNAASLVLQGNVLGYKLLLTGDVEKEGEEELLNEGLEHVDILKVAHHGSKNSTSEEFLRMVAAKNAIISCGKYNRYGHPHQETISRLQGNHTKIIRTDQKGAIIFGRKRDG